MIHTTHGSLALPSRTPVADKPVIDFCARNASQLTPKDSPVQTAVKEGATLVCGGKRVGTRGFFLEPTVITGVEDGTVSATQESFGPIMLISKFESLDEVR